MTDYESMYVQVYNGLTFKQRIDVLNIRPDVLYLRIFEELVKTPDFQYIRTSEPDKFEMAMSAKVPIKPWERDLVRDPTELFKSLVRDFADTAVGKTYPPVTEDDLSSYLEEGFINVTLYLPVPTPPDPKRLLGAALGAERADMGQ